MRDNMIQIPVGLNDPRLRIRLRNCLQTILDLELVLQRMEITRPLLDEFGTLRNVYTRLDALPIAEDDVQRIEEATASFLCELKNAMPEKIFFPGSRILQ